MKLYLLTTAGGADYFVVAETATDAEHKLLLLLDRSQLIDRSKTVVNIKVLSREITMFPGNKPNFSEPGPLLILPDSCSIKAPNIEGGK